jgi:hypothetical protein
MRIWAIGVTVFLTQAACAGAPATSERPVARDADVLPVQVAPFGAESQDEARGGLFSSMRPLFRSPKVAREARVERKLRAKGAICGDIDIQGSIVGRVPGRISGCGVEDAVKVRSVSGIGLSQEAVMDCATAAALKTWVDQSAKPAFARKGGGLKSLRVAAHYSCRTRNNKKGAKISEHGKGRAIDISAFRLHDGTEVTLLKGWNSSRYRSAMRQVHKGACGPFGTVLGPNADRYHQDHFHFVTARYRSGSYCK